MAGLVAVPGGGRVGHAMALDLAHEGEFELRVADASAAALESLAGTGHLETMPANLADAAEIRRAVAGADVAIGAVPGSMGCRTLETVIDAGVDVVDITVFEERAGSVSSASAEPPAASCATASRSKADGPSPSDRRFGTSDAVRKLARLRPRSPGVRGRRLDGARRARGAHRRRLKLSRAAARRSSR